MSIITSWWMYSWLPGMSQTKMTLTWSFQTSGSGTRLLETYTWQHVESAAHHSCSISLQSSRAFIPYFFQQTKGIPRIHDLMPSRRTMSRNKVTHIIAGHDQYTMCRKLHCLDRDCKTRSALCARSSCPEPEQTAAKAPPDP